MPKKHEMVGTKWERTGDIEGHRPMFNIRCRHCDEDMFLRYTQVLMRKNKLRHADSDCNQMAFKCWRCGNMERFNVRDKRKYLLAMLKRRKGITLYYPPKSKWASINPFVKKKLESLGYV